MISFFENLGDRVEKLWCVQNYDEAVFPKIATQVFTETNPHENVDPWDIINWLFTATNIPNQHDIPGRFGDPPITLYDGPRFQIDVYYWLDGTTAIHQHGFSGALYVFDGSSIHSQYAFENKVDVNEHFATGQIRLDSVELLMKGDIRPIRPGENFIHALFHLDHPSVSLVIRSHSTPSSQPQYSYLSPHFAFDPFFQSPDISKKTQSVSLLLGMDHPDADSLIGTLLAGADFQTTFRVLDQVNGHLAERQLDKVFGMSTGHDRFKALLDISRQRHGELVNLIPPVFAENKRQRYLITRRGLVTSSEHRFFLALLLNVPDRLKIIEFVKKRYPDKDPIDTITEWLEELATTKTLGSSEPNVLGIDDYDEDYLFVFRCLLEGHGNAAIRKKFIEGFSSKEDIQSAIEKCDGLVHAIEHSMLFSRL